jgi:uncharacterized protein with HEPN domain
MTERDLATLLDIERAAQLTGAFVADIDLAAFLADLKTQSAVLHQIAVIGEAVKRLSPAFRAAHPILPWRLIAGMRDQLIHRYDSVDLDEVWNTVQRDLPALRAAIAPLLTAEN